MSGTDIAYGAISTYARAMRCPRMLIRYLLRPCHAMPGTDMAYAPTRNQGDLLAHVTPVCGSKVDHRPYTLHPTPYTRHPRDPQP
eukprot:3122360-Rhodomonas_salina.1